MRSVAFFGWLCSSEYFTVCQGLFSCLGTQSDVYPCTFLFVLLHWARTTAQATISTVHRAFLPPASYSTTTLLPSSGSSGHTLRVSMIEVRPSKLVCLRIRYLVDHLNTPRPYHHRLSPCCFFCIYIDVCDSTLSLL